LRTKRNDIIEHMLRMAQDAAPESIKFNQDVLSKFGLSRQQVVRYARDLCLEGKIRRISSGRGAAYVWEGITSLHCAVDLEHHSELRDLQHEKLRNAIQSIKPGLKAAQANALEILTKDLLVKFAFFWPSESSRLMFSEEFPSIIVQFSYENDGLFKRIQKLFGLSSLLDAIAALAKSVDSQSGATSIFEILHASDFATIESDSVIWEYSPRAMDWSVRRTDRHRNGTFIRLEIERNNSRFLSRIADIHSGKMQRDMSCLLMVATVAQNNKRACSRAEAKQLLKETDSFSKLIVDFRHVERVGLGFLDEIFVQQQLRRPDITIEHRNMNDILRNLLARVVETLKNTNRRDSN
jgi:hypothetical protein